VPLRDMLLIDGKSPVSPAPALDRVDINSCASFGVRSGYESVLAAGGLSQTTIRPVADNININILRTIGWLKS
jgi:hypothetical protein